MKKKLGIFFIEKNCVMLLWMIEQFSQGKPLKIFVLHIYHLYCPNEWYLLKTSTYLNLDSSFAISIFQEIYIYNISKHLLLILILGWCLIGKYCLLFMKQKVRTQNSNPLFLQEKNLQATNLLCTQTTQLIHCVIKMVTRN